MDNRQILDLNVHGPRDIAGKEVVFSGIEYQIIEQIGEGGEAWVFSIKNKQSKMIDLVTKVFRFRPGSAEYIDIVQNRGQIAFLFSDKGPTVSLSEDGFRFEGEGINAEPIEIFEAHGGLLGLQKLISGGAHPDYQFEIMNVGNSFASAKNYEKAAQTYDSVLRNNPNHTDALHNKAQCLVMMDHVSAGLKLLLRCIEIEPHLRRFYTNCAKIFLNSERPDLALKILEKSLRRNANDFSTWRLFVETALNFDLVDGSEDLIRYGIELDSDNPLMEQVAVEVSRSKERWHLHSQLAGSALSAQEDDQWRKALGLWTEAISLSKRKPFAYLNRGLCSFMLDQSSATLSDIWPNLGSYSPPPLFSAMLLMFLAAVKEEEWEKAKIAVQVLGQLNEAVDLPQIPIVIREEFSKDRVGVDLIVEALKSIYDKFPQDILFKVRVDSLMKGYRELERLIKQT